MDSQIWGTIVKDEGPVWRLSDGRIAKKANENIAWYVQPTKTHAPAVIPRRPYAGASAAVPPTRPYAGASAALPPVRPYAGASAAVPPSGAPTTIPVTCQGANSIQLPAKPKNTCSVNEGFIYIKIKIIDPEFIRRLNLRRTIIQDYLHINPKQDFHFSLFDIKLNLDSPTIKKLKAKLLQNGTTLDIEIAQIVNTLTNKLKLSYVGGKDGYFILGLLNNFYTKVFKLDDSDRTILFSIQEYIIGFLGNYDKFGNNVTKWTMPTQEFDTNKILIYNGTDHLACLSTLYDYNIENKLHISLGKFNNHCVKKIIQDPSKKNVLIDELYRIILAGRFEQLIDGNDYTCNFSKSSKKNADLVCSSQI